MAEPVQGLHVTTLRSARAAYVRTLERVDEATWRMSLPGALPWWGPKRDRPLDPPPPVAWIDHQGRSTGRDRSTLPAAEFLERRAALLGIPVGRLAVRRRDAATTRLRRTLRTTTLPLRLVPIRQP